MPRAKRLRVFAGPDGWGKTTTAFYVYAIWLTKDKIIF